MHAPASWSEERWNVFTGAVIAADSSPRDAGASGRRVLQATLAEHTGVVMLAAWGAHAEELAKMLVQLEQCNSANIHGMYWLRVELFGMSPMKNCLRDVCPIGTIGTVNAAKGKRPPAGSICTEENAPSTIVDLTVGTRFSIVPGSEIETPSPTRMVGFSSSITGISNFLLLETLHPPFCVNLSGIIVDVSEVRTTVRNNPKCMRTLQLSDVNGCRVVLHQLGSPVEDADVQRARHVIAYFVCGSKAKKPGDGGALWAFEDTYLKIGRMASTVPDCVKEVVIPDA